MGNLSISLALAFVCGVLGSICGLSDVGCMVLAGVVGGGHLLVRQS